jgi:hypothetical protein
MRTRRASGEILAEDLERLYAVERRSIEAVAVLLGWSPSAVRTQLVKLGIARRTPWARNAVTCDVDELRRLYEQGLTMTAIAAQVGCSLTTVWHKLTGAGVVARPAAAVHARADFSGDLAEQAYLVGFRQGDLHVVWESASTVVVKCTSTRVEQVELFRALFERYGHVITDEATLARRARQSIGMEVRLNRSFAFLVPKADALPDWVSRSDEAFFAFLAGYIDAEGYIKVSLPRGYRTPQAFRSAHVRRQPPAGAGHRFERACNSVSGGGHSRPSRLRERLWRAQQWRPVGAWSFAEGVAKSALPEAGSPPATRSQTSRYAPSLGPG